MIKIKNKKYYLIISSKSGFKYGCFDRTKLGKQNALNYKEKLEHKFGQKFLIR
jgi:hypothetical protein